MRPVIVPIVKHVVPNSAQQRRNRKNRYHQSWFRVLHQSRRELRDFHRHSAEAELREESCPTRCLRQLAMSCTTVDQRGMLTTLRQGIYLQKSASKHAEIRPVVELQ